MSSHRSKKNYLHTCEFCNKEFKNYDKNTRFCSMACRNKWLGKLRRKNQVCQECGKEFYDSQHHKFCSKECKKTWKIKKIEERKIIGKLKPKKEFIKNCERCGREFTTHNKRTRYCSQSCASIVNNAKIKKYKICKECGVPFYKRNDWGVVFCSDECRNKYQDRKRDELRKIRNEKWIKAHTINCEYCGKQFITKNLQIRCCSNECLEKHKKESYKEYYYNYFIKNYKSKIIECKNCGTVFETKYGDKQRVFCCKECGKHYGHQIKKLKEKYKEDKKLALKKRDELIAKNYVEPVNYNKLYKRDCGICKICGMPVLAKGVDYYWSGSIDHIVPISLGGEHSMSNCQLAHRICNSIKLQNQDGFKIDWEEKCKTSNYWNQIFQNYKDISKHSPPTHKKKFMIPMGISSHGGQ